MYLFIYFPAQVIDRPIKCHFNAFPIITVNNFFANHIKLYKQVFRLGIKKSN